MKTMGTSVEEVTEYAKYLVLAERTWQLKEDQLYVVANQHHKQLILENKFEFCVTDSPLLLASFYAPPNTPSGFHGMCAEYAARFDNLNFFITRDLDDGDFQTSGRIHGKEDSRRIEGEQKEFLAKLGEEWTEVRVGDSTPWDIVEATAGRWPDLFAGTSMPARPAGRVSL